jgi:phage major head subunit gpT-like protein
MILDAANLSDVFVGFNTMFHNAFEAAPKTHDRYAMVVPSDGETESYKWLGQVPRVRQWIGDRTFDQLRAYKYNITNVTWESGIEVERDDIEDDKLGLVAPRIKDLATVAQESYCDLIFDLCTTGFTQTCYDGQFFFDTDHSDAGSANQGNKATASLDDAGAFDTAFAAMMAYKAENGVRLNIRPTHLVVPPQLRSTAMTIVGNQFLANGASNPNYGVVELVVEPRLADYPTRWFMFDLSKTIKPFVLQVRRPFEFIAMDAPTDESAFMRNKFRYGVSARHNAGYGLWQCAYGSDGTT